MIPTLLFISLVAFAIIQAPPGDFLNSYVSQLRLSGDLVDQSVIDELRARYGLDQPLIIQYLKWMRGVFVGDFGQSFEWDMPVRDLIGERLLLTIVVSTASILFTYLFAVPIRSVFGHSPIRGRRLPVHLSRVPGAGHAQLPAGPDVDVLLYYTFGLVYLVFNTITILTTQDQQVACFRMPRPTSSPVGASSSR